MINKVIEEMFLTEPQPENRTVSVHAETLRNNINLLDKSLRALKDKDAEIAKLRNRIATLEGKIEYLELEYSKTYIPLNRRA